MKAQLVLIESDKDHREALAALHRLMEQKDPGTVALRRAQALLIAHYEARRWPSKPATPAEILRFVMEDHRLSPAALGAVLGSRSRVSEILRGKRALSLAMIRRLRSTFHIPADVLIGEEKPARRRLRRAA